jgi:hypothetical protein
MLTPKAKAQASHFDNGDTNVSPISTARNGERLIFYTAIQTKQATTKDSTTRTVEDCQKLSKAI